MSPSRGGRIPEPEDRYSYGFKRRGGSPELEARPILDVQAQALWVGIDHLADDMNDIVGRAVLLILWFIHDHRPSQQPTRTNGSEQGGRTPEFVYKFPTCTGRSVTRVYGEHNSSTNPHERSQVKSIILTQNNMVHVRGRYTK